MRKEIVLLLLSIMISVIAFCQKPDDDDPFEKVSYFMYGVNYLSNNVYLGRKDTLVIPYYSPYLGYHFKNGLYLKGMASITSTGGTHLDLTTLEAGYDHSFTDHFNTSINAEKFIYNKNSLSIRANTVASAGVNGQYTNDWVEPTAGVDINFNKKSTDYVTNLMLDHDFKIGKKTHILPQALINAGTEHYLDEYYVDRLTRKDKTLKIKKVLANANKFVPLDYEISVKATFMTPKWLFTLVPTYAIPVSAATLTLPNRVVTEQLSNSFYVEFDICHR